MHSRLRPLVIALLVAVQFLLPQGCAQPVDDVGAALQQMLAGAGQPYLHAHDPPASLETLKALYRKRGYAPIWLRSGRPGTAALHLLAAFHGAGTYGLKASDYDVAWLDARTGEWSAADATQAAQLDLRLSSAALRLVSHLHFGRVDPRSAGFGLRAPRADLNRVATLEQLASTTDTETALAAIEPDFDHYRLLKDALARYHRLAADANLTAPPAFAGRSIRPGAPYAGAPLLRRLLVAFGDMADAPAAADDETLDDTLAAALRGFQERHGLTADGVLGQRTFLALTVPLTLRVRQIELTLERWRWLPAFETPPIVVNLPEFRLFAFRSTADREADMLRMAVIVGQSFPRTRTPVFVAAMKYVVFRPYWDIPRTILQREILPDLRGDPKYLELNHMELVRGASDDSPVVPPTPENIEALTGGELRLRQRPGRARRARSCQCRCGLDRGEDQVGDERRSESARDSVNADSGDDSVRHRHGDRRWPCALLRGHLRTRPQIGPLAENAERLADAGR